jgi:hypothetical protein
MRHRAVRLLALTATGALALGAAPSPTPPAFERSIEAGAPRGEVAGDEDRPWTERHPSLLWGGLLAVVVALGGLTWRALHVAG